MELLSRGRTSDRPLRGVLVEEVLFVALATMVQLCAAQSVIFQNGYSTVPLVVPNDPNAYVAQLGGTIDEFTYGGGFQPGASEGALNFTTDFLASPGAIVNSSGSCFYNNPIQFSKQSDCSQLTAKSFSTMFTLQASPKSDQFQGNMIAFVITSNNSTLAMAMDLGDLGPALKFSVELDFLQDMRSTSPVGVQVAVDTNNQTLNSSKVEVNQSSLSSLTTWIEYQGSNRILEIFVAVDGSLNKPRTPIIQMMELNLSEELISNETMFVGFFVSCTNVTVPETIVVLQWSFNSDGLAPDYPRNPDGSLKDLQVEALKKRNRKIITIVAITVPCVALIMILMMIIWILYRRNAKLIALAKKYEIEEGLLDQGPQNFKYKVLSAATKGFSSQELLGRGGFGSVYRGRLWLQGAAAKPTNVAVKRISADSRQGAREFVAEVKIIGQVQHRNLVRLLGWCHERGELLLVYDYMPNGSVDQHLYKNQEKGLEGPLLTWSRRLKIVSGVATALTYLHEEWEQQVIHRDVKSSNVMLDRDFNARLGDFGLARLSEHDQAPPSTVVLAGTYGYLAPEMARTLRATEKTDVYSFGAMVLEVATGKRPILSFEERTKCNELLLVDWVWGLYRDDALLEAADSRLENAFDPGEMIMFLKIGLLCSHPDPDERPTMREVLNIWKCSSPFPPLPRSKPVPVFTRITDDSDVTMTFSGTGHHGHLDDSEGELFTSQSDESDFTPFVTSGCPSMPNLRYRPSNITTPLPL